MCDITVAQHTVALGYRSGDSFPESSRYFTGRGSTLRSGYIEMHGGIKKKHTLWVIVRTRESGGQPVLTGLEHAGHYTHVLIERSDLSEVFAITGSDTATTRFHV